MNQVLNKLLNSIMKKFFIFASSLLFVNCSSNQNEELVEESYGLVEVSLGATATDKGETRAFLGTVEGDEIGVKFESSDFMDIFDSYVHEDRHVFRSTLTQDNQSGSFKGRWQDKEEAYAAIFPADPTKQTKVTLGTTGNTYRIIISDEQESPTINDGHMVSCDRIANVLLGGRATKTYGHGIFLSPICTYLYFASYNENVTISSTNHNIAGTTIVTTSTKEWEGDQTFAKGLTITCNGTKSIQATGTHVNRQVPNGVTYDPRVYEFVVCLVPGSFEAGDLHIGGKTNSVALNLERGHMYKIGTIDTPPASPDPTTPTE